MPATVGMGALLCHRALLLRVGEQNIVGPQVLFSTLGPTDSDRRPRGNPGASSRGNAGAHGVRRLAISGDSSGARGTQARDVLPRPGGGQSSHSVEAALVLVGLMGGPDRAVFFLRVEAPQIQFNNRDVHNLVLLSKMSWAIHQQSGRTPDSRLSVLSPAVLETCTVRVKAERRTWRGSLGVHGASQSSHACLSLVLRVVCCCARTFHLFTCCTPVCARWMPHRCMRKGVRNSCVAYGVRCRRGTKGVVSSPSEDIPSDIKETEAHLRTAGDVL